MSSGNSPSNENDRLGPGEQIGAYKVEYLLGSGGMADVYYAVHEGLARPAALKVLRASLAADEKHLQRFMQEARAAASLTHPNIVQIYDVGQAGEARYIAQEYVPGSNLRQYLTLPNPDDHLGTEQLAGAEKSAADLLDSKQLELPAALSILLQILAALTKSASCGIVHRDIKPENIMLSRDGEVKVADFGLARVLLGDDPKLTRAGTALGTPMYMSPEQIEEREVDIRSDLYSLGVTLFHMLCGRPPFIGETPLALAMQHVQNSAPNPQDFRSDLPKSLQDLVLKLLAKNPDERFESPKEVVEFLRQAKSSDLTAFWPDETIPLPEVSVGRGPTAATLTLQAKLNKGKQDASKIWQGLGAAALLAVCFLGGVFLNQGSAVDPLAVDQTDDNTMQGIAREISAREQYRMALLNNNGTSVDIETKWDAVEYYFPKEEDASNRLYAGLAQIQLARIALEQNEDIQDAKRHIDEVIRDDKMPSVVHALALLHEACLHEKRGSEPDMRKAVELAHQTLTDDSTALDQDLQMLEAAVQYMPQLVQENWQAKFN